MEWAAALSYLVMPELETKAKAGQLAPVHIQLQDSGLARH